jgi:hypothetical protein
MPITAYLGDQRFEPDVVASMSAAFENVRRVLALGPERNSQTDLVAIKIIELAQACEHNVDALTASVLDIFGVKEF